MQILCQAYGCWLQAEHYDRTRQQQIDIGLLAPEEAQASAEQVPTQCSATQHAFC